MRRFLMVTIALSMLGLLTGVTLAGTITGTVQFKNRRQHADILVFVEKVGDNKFEPPKQHAIMDQTNLMFKPFILPIVVGTTVDFLNSDSVLHNVFTPDKEAGEFNLGTWPQGETRAYKFDQIGSAVALCNVHPEMEAYVVTLPNPYYAVSDREGKFTIPSKPNPDVKADERPMPPELPAGKYILHVWHPKGKLYTEEIAVPEKGAVSIDVSLSRGKAKNIATIYKKD